MQSREAHPVQLFIERSGQARRIHLATRAVLVLALGTLGCSSIYWLLYLALPVLAALDVSRKGRERALAEDGPRAVHVLRWLAAAYAYLGTLTDALPASEGGPVDLRVQTGAGPTPASALLRLLTSLPALVLVTLLAIVAGILWVVAMVWILAVERVPAVVSDFLTLTLRTTCRLAAYHVSLVDRYPSLEATTFRPVTLSHAS